MLRVHVANYDTEGIKLKKQAGWKVIKQHGDLVEMEDVGGKELKQMRTLMVRCSPYEIDELNKLTPADAIKVGTKLLSFLDFQGETTKKKVK